MKHWYTLAVVGSRKIPLRLALLLGAWHMPAGAQTLDEQYENYLAGSCTNMNFQRDGFFNLLPGQAGPQLTAFCDGPPPVGGGTITNGASGGGASAAASRSLADDSTLRRRRAARRAKNADDTTRNIEAVQSKASTDEFSVASSGKASMFLSLRYQREKQEVTHFEGGRRSDLFNATAGVDYRFTSAAVAGIAVKTEEQSGDFDSGGDFQTSTTGVLLYGSWYPLANFFVDFTAGMDFLSLDTKRFVSFSRTVVSAGFANTVVLLPPTAANSKPDSRATEAELRSGYDFVSGAVTVGPRVGIKNRRTTLDAYAESGATPMTLAFDEQSVTSLIGSAGVQFSKVFTPASGVLVTQVNLDWLHEFRNDQRTITARFAEDLRTTPTQLQFQNEAPDRDVLAARVSMVAVFSHGLSCFLSLDSLFGHAYLNRYGANIGVRKEF